MYTRGFVGKKLEILYHECTECIWHGDVPTGVNHNSKCIPSETVTKIISSSVASGIYLNLAHDVQISARRIHMSSSRVPWKIMTGQPPSPKRTQKERFNKALLRETNGWFSHKNNPTRRVPESCILRGDSAATWIWNFRSHLPFSMSHRSKIIPKRISTVSIRFLC